MTTNAVVTVEADVAVRPLTRPCSPPELGSELGLRVARIAECRDRPQLRPREPDLTESERRDLEALLPAYRAYLEPGAIDEISNLLTRLRAHYFVPEVPDAFGKALADDWGEDLAPYPLWAVKAACSRYRRTKTRPPRPANIVSLAEDEIESKREEMRELELALAVPPSDNAEPTPVPPACSVWRDHHAELCADFGVDVYDQWLKMCIPESHIDGVLTLAVPTVFFRDHIDKTYKEGLQKTLGRTVVIVQRGWSADANRVASYKARLEAEEAARRPGSGGG